MKQPHVSNELAAQNLAAMIFGLNKGEIPKDLWPRLSDELQADITAFVTKWPPGTSRERVYRNYKEAKPENNDVTPIRQLG